MDVNSLVIPALNLAVTVGLVEVVKRTKLVTNRFLPVVALVVGVATFYVGATSSVLVGLAVGLSAMGLFSGGKTLLGK